MNPYLFVGTTILDSLMRNSAEKRRRKRELEQLRIQDELDRIATEDTARYMGETNLLDYVMKGESDPALWQSIASYVNPLDHAKQIALNKELYDTTTDVSSITQKPVGFVSPGFDTSAAAAATRVTDAASAKNALRAANQAYAVQDPWMSGMAGQHVGSINRARGLGEQIAQSMVAERFEPTNVDALQEELKTLGNPITAPPNLTGMLTGVANIQAQNKMLAALDA